MTEAIVRSASEHDLTELLNLYRHLHPHDPSLETDIADLVWSALLSSSFMTVIVAQAAELLVSSCTLAIVPNLSRGGRSYGVIENVVTHATIVGWGSADRFWSMLSTLLGRRTATKSCWRPVRSGRPPCDSMRERAFIAGGKPTSKYADLSSYADPSAPTLRPHNETESIG